MYNDFAGIYKTEHGFIASRKINVLEMHSCLGYTGGERNLVTFCKYLDKSLFNVYAGSYIRGGIQEERLKKLGIEFVVGQESIVPIINLIREKKIDVVHMHRGGEYNFLETEIINAAKQINKNIVIVEKNVFGHFDPVSGKDIACSMFQSMMHLHERYLPKSGLSFDFSRMLVMYNMVDNDSFEKFRLSGEEVDAYKNELGIKQDEYVIGKIATPHIAKWSDLILEMMPYLVKLEPKVKFIIVGVPESRVKVIKSSGLRNNFIILPELKNEADVHRFYQTIDILAHSSKIGECNGNTINEAMFWRKPVVVNSTSRKDNGQLEQIDHMESGIVANYPQTYSRAIAYLLKNRNIREQMGDKARDRVCIVNNPLTIVHQLEKLVIRKLLEKGFIFDNSVNQYYDGIKFFPSKEEILDYKEEYKKRLGYDYRVLSKAEKIVNLLRVPKRFFWKLRDFLSHKSSDIYARLIK